MRPEPEAQLSAGAALDLSVQEELFRSRSDVLDDLAEQEGRDVASAVYWNGRATTVWIWMSELLVGTSLSDFFKAHLLEDRDDLSRTEDG